MIYTDESFGRDFFIDLRSIPDLSAKPSFNKLAQVDQAQNDALETKFDNPLKKGILIESINDLVSRAGAKLISSRISYALSTVESTSLNGSYRRTYNCGDTIIVEDGKATSKYCKNRWCLVCNRIRTAQLMNDYLHIVDNWGTDAYFVTVTIPNVTKTQLPIALQKMQSAFTTIKRRMKRTYDLDFISMRKIECTYNSQRNDYHPHYHIVFKGNESGCVFIDEWLKEFPEASFKAQDIRPANINVTKELFKYFTKIFAKSGEKDSQGNDLYEFDANNMSPIFESMKGLRTFQTYGFKKTDYQKPENADYSEIINDVIDELGLESKSNEVNEIVSEGVYKWIEDNWYNDSTGEAICSFRPTKKMRNLIAGIRFNEYEPIPPPQNYIYNSTDLVYSQ